MEYSNVVADFAERTAKNLETIRRLHIEGAEVFEFTQLVNSMLGLLIFPRERYVNQIPKLSMEELEARGWPVPVTAAGFKIPTNLCELFRMLRNGIAHCNIEFLTDHNRDLMGLRIWNDNNGRKTWEAELTEDQLESLTRKFVALLITGSVT